MPPCARRLAWTVPMMRSIGVTVGNIMAAIIPVQTPRNVSAPLTDQPVPVTPDAAMAVMVVMALMPAMPLMSPRASPDTPPRAATPIGTSMLRVWYTVSDQEPIVSRTGVIRTANRPLPAAVCMVGSIEPWCWRLR